ncbi:MAG TPA: DUF620 domain-containing protein [Bryobacteraceae bacterium]|nr:DUF620 domain-containing protein [Bryobacteraceae bacterium]
MNRFAKQHYWIGMAMVLAAAGTVQAADDLPKADTILDKYVEVTGGKAAYSKLHTETQTGLMDFSAMGLKGKVTSYHSEPDLTLVEINIDGIGKITEGSNGQVAWSLSAMQGPRLKEGSEKSEALLHAQFNGDLRWRDLYSNAETVGVEQVDGKDCYKVVLTPKSGNPITRWYDKNSGLLLKMRVKANSPMGEIEADSVVSEYRKEGDILLPHKIVQKVATMEIGMTVENVQYNLEIPKDKFDVPAEIKALMNKPADK